MKIRKLPSLERLNELFVLDADRGVLLRKTQRGCFKAGEVCGTKMKGYDYVMVCVDAKRYLAHRVIYFMATGVDPEDMTIDHINGNQGDNRLCNLRLATVQENRRHQPKHRSDNKTGHRNVSWDNTWVRWKVSVNIGGKRIQRKFQDLQDAVACATTLRHQHFKEFAGLTA
jgi:hypothetical protein